MPNTGSQSKTKRPNNFQNVIFVDRDGVINYDNLAGYITRWKYFKFIPGSLKALAQLTKAGFKIVIISNQAGIGDGVYPKKELIDITRKMKRKMKQSGVKVAGIYYCLHGKKAGCKCRKPKTGLFKQAAHDISFYKRKTYFIGDKISDLLAGKRFGLRTGFVLTGHGKHEAPKIPARLKPDVRGANLLQLTRRLLKSL